MRFEKKRYQSPEWRAFRERILKERNYICERCGHAPDPVIRRGRMCLGLSLEVHHKAPELGFITEEANYICLCKSCHSYTGKEKKLSPIQSRWKEFANEDQG